MADNGSKRATLDEKKKAWKVTDYEIAHALAVGKKVSEVATLLSVSERTVHRRKSDAEFNILLNSVKESYVERLGDKSRENTDEIFDNLLELTRYQNNTALNAIKYLVNLMIYTTQTLNKEIPYNEILHTRVNNDLSSKRPGMHDVKNGQSLYTDHDS